ncbi:TIGR04086 family membrane protein [Paenibacillus tarimensis]
MMNQVPKVRITSPLISGIVYAAVWLGTGALILSLALHFSGLKESELPQYAYIIHAFSTLAGGFVSGKRAGRSGWYNGFLLGLIYGILVILIGFLAMDTLLTVRSVVMLAMTSASGAIGGMIGVNAKK